MACGASRLPVCGRFANTGCSLTHVCSCGLIPQRGWNAAINILLKAKSTVGQTGSNAKGVGTSTLLGANQACASSDDELRIPSALTEGSVKIVGYGDASDNPRDRRLALERAKTVRDALIEQGVAPRRLQVAGMTNHPIDVDADQPLWLSRCVEFELVTPVV